MNPLGFMSYIYMGLSAEEMLREAKKHGLRYIQLDPRQKLGVMDEEPLSPVRAQRLRALFEEGGIAVIGLSGYTNLMLPDPAKREQKLRQLEKMIDLCPHYGTRYILTETGSLHPTNSWRDCPENRTAEAWEQLVGTIGRLRDRAVENGAVLIIEGFVNNVLGSPRQAVQLTQELGSEGLEIVMDPFNYLTQDDLLRQREAMTELFDAVGPACPMAHAKDALYAEDGTFTTPRVGTGQADWPLYAELLARRLPEVPLILEHAKPEEVGECLERIAAAFKAGTGRGQPAGEGTARHGA
ncbi:sugar phosphate isomerase/epimerase family protein [Paenibacillus mucilaginosus]|uniref:Xylose isomerase domain-containing protein n=2 Tax=Paenibacillus mucilaginosus TaxID=61624 RepID=H6NLI7_9BACL|nr:sugar phosphate isomerase/epimerase [Paenibacillus mucilaginosus]AEI43265.1 Xylose isomerase domain protein TIM barrel [Paenibacillus mucilaginosus KNP414]AFC30921.1 xylose isomerase domain-containing protein [Paenibacillus mucilaginosus 3016]MCG7212180.1 sugar phosphate isomerase/epimerase [Paenibacillus mucilaginosus]WDM24850.1 sugar phosphate isomerase/epimerase [Paenibacillus mucilaginosus]WFA19521.1 sugar phosphate isomerase/epimerase [Paenibacillus mucilaginosus]